MIRGDEWAAFAWLAGAGLLWACVIKFDRVAKKRNQEYREQVDRDLVVIQTFQEALALLSYGAKDEALELLKTTIDDNGKATKFKVPE